MTDTDVQRLRQALADATSEVERVKTRDAATSSRLSRELDDLRDEVAYVRVKLRKEGRVSRAEYFDLRDRIDDLRSRAGADVATATKRDRERSEREIPVGTEIDVRLVDGLSSGRNQVEDRFVATTVVDLQLGERVVIPAGSELRGIVSGVDKAGRVDRKAGLTLAFDRITLNGREREIRGIVTDTIEGEGVKGESRQDRHGRRRRRDHRRHPRRREGRDCRDPDRRRRHRRGHAGQGRRDRAGHDPPRAARSAAAGDLTSITRDTGTRRRTETLLGSPGKPSCVSVPSCLCD